MAVINNAFETQGTHLYFVSQADTSAEDVLKVTCPTGIQGINAGTADKIDTTCLDVVDGYRQYIGGLADAGELSVPFVLYKGDRGHQELFTLKNSRSVIGWYVGLSDSTADPTVDTAGALVSPAERTGFSFLGYVSGLTIDASTNEVIRGTLTIQSTGTVTPHWAA